MLLFHSSNIECLNLRLAHAFYTFISKCFNEEMFIYHIWIVEHTAVVSSAFRLPPSISMADERDRKGESKKMNAERRNAERVEKAESIPNTQMCAEPRWMDNVGWLHHHPLYIMYCIYRRVYNSKNGNNVLLHPIHYTQRLS